MRGTLAALCASSRLAGSEESKAGAAYAAGVFAEAGLEVRRQVYEVHLPRQTRAFLALLPEAGSQPGAVPLPLVLEETTNPKDPLTEDGLAPPMHGLTGTGRVQGRLVFAGRGTSSEFEALAEKVPLDGTIALIRYGGLYRGMKVRNAALAGCAGALVYTDPEDDGSGRGEILPHGPWRAPGTIQRGSVRVGNGDPLSPGWAALPGARRLPMAQADGVPPIPSLPVSWENATKLLGPAGRPGNPSPLERSVVMEVEQDSTPVRIENVLAVIPGSREPDSWVVFGAHRDAWGRGAIDNGTGITVLLETARILGAATRRGWKPERTLILGTWDGEEWGLVGSTEWVEQHLGPLRDGGVAYINLDVAVSGPSFSAWGSPGLQAAITRACESEGLPAPKASFPGGGSDHVPFLEKAGMEVGGFGFHGGHGTYHSAWDTPWVVETHIDPDFRLHARATRLAVELARELSSTSCRVDGAWAWSVAARDALESMGGKDLDPLRDLMNRLAASAEAGKAPHPHRFLRLFLGSGPRGKLLLRRSAGYGSSWFPDLVSDSPSDRAGALEILEARAQAAVAALGASPR